jgi:hypothetical protein
MENVHPAANRRAIILFFLGLCLDGGESLMLRSAARVALAPRNVMERRQIAFKSCRTDSDRGIGNTVVQVAAFPNKASLGSVSMTTWCSSSR